MFVHVYKSKPMCLHTLCLRKKVKEREREGGSTRGKSFYVVFQLHLPSTKKELRDIGTTTDNFLYESLLVFQ